MTKTRIKIREEFAFKGLSYTAWAKKNGYSANMVIDIVNDNDTNPKRKCLRGECHNIAVALGLKEGEVCRQSVVA
ncbi:DNA-binding protein [Glaciimonas immobilis]|uniref:Gp16 family phage-associated protein n=1 Tax=Glaciimonas immobilis TaxID=728004 RepID=A0A840RPA0_9BURK|nr:DNA-binding protein [Glaciimonas immobilis]KAF3999043.1 DNA-binding protein [Glaciimonas immobilis]MBB5198470.1 gp16 family phage-associated protein [Glaciimonas immobilis]